MAVYGYRCETCCVAFQASYPMGQAPSAPTHEPCGAPAKRVYEFHFQEDRYRLFRNPVDGTTHSYSLGIEHPDNRADYHQALAERGCEPVTAGTTPTKWKEDREYLAHVRSGGERLKHEEQPPPGPPVGVSVLEQMKKSGFRVG